MRVISAIMAAIYLVLAIACFYFGFTSKDSAAGVSVLVGVVLAFQTYKLIRCTTK